MAFNLNSSFNYFVTVVGFVLLYLLEPLSFHLGDPSIFEKDEPFTLPSLPGYNYSSLEPYINRDIMKYHHANHHQTYVNKLNEWKDKLQSIDLIPTNNLHLQKGLKYYSERENSMMAEIKFNYGGHLNHAFFWENLTPSDNSSLDTSQFLKDELIKTFGSIMQFKEKLVQAGLSVKGSGWVWLVYNYQYENLKGLMITTTANQDPVNYLQMIPILGIDVWEHAYYLQYYYDRKEYLNQIWHVVNWQNVEKYLRHAYKETST